MMEPTPEKKTNLTLPDVSSEEVPKREYEVKNSYKTTPLSNFSPLFNLPDTDSKVTWGYKIFNATEYNGLNFLAGQTQASSSTSISTSK